MRVGELGRFAPSPTGALHAGSLIAALASHASAHSGGGRWLVRIDDLDAPRAVTGADHSILGSLRRLGLLDSSTRVIRQSERLTVYRAALHRLAAAGALFRCRCSRRMLADSTVYPGHCRQRTLDSAGLQQWLARPGSQDESLRVRLRGPLAFDDGVQGRRSVQLEGDVGDVVVLRRDGIIAWPLATACDDAAPVTEVVRGADLFDPAPAQIALMLMLALTPPRYAHVPVLTDSSGVKLGKSTKARPIDGSDPLELLQAAWQCLGQRSLGATSLPDFHARSAAEWQVAMVPKLRTLFDPALT